MPQEKRSARENFNYSDVSLLPGEAKILDSDAVDLEINLGVHSFRSPIFIENIAGATTPKDVAMLNEVGYFHVQPHLFFHSEVVREMKKRRPQHISITLKNSPDGLALLNTFREQELSPDFILVEDSFGDQQTNLNLIRTVRSLFSESFIMGGNAMTGEGARRLADAGAQAVKVSSGSPQTKLYGFGDLGELSTIAEVSEALDGTHPGVKIIATGAKTGADVAKALAFGADLAMVRGLAGAPILKTLEAADAILRETVRLTGGTQLSDLRNSSYVRIS